MMPEESAAPELVERWRQTNEPFVRRDFEAMMGFFAPDAVWDLSSAGIGRFEGTVAIRSFHEDWIGSYEERVVGSTDIDETRAAAEGLAQERG